MPNYLTTLSTIMCPHGGQAILSTANQKVSAGTGAQILLESDVHTIAGCPFTTPEPKYSPCTTIEWQSGTGTQRQKINQTSALTQSSVGLCKSAEGLVQGTAIVANTQLKVSGL